MTPQEVQSLALKRAHARWSAAPRPPTPLADRKDYGVHDRDFDDPDPELFQNFLDQELARLHAQGQPST